jgi:hypothetical protein
MTRCYDSELFKRRQQSNSPTAYSVELTIARMHRYALPPAPERKHTTTWPAFIRTHLPLLAGTDFFTAEVLTLRGLVTYYVHFFNPSRTKESCAPRELSR